jgi:hypothetical protein
MKEADYSRAEALMRQAMEDQRRAPRTPVCLSAIVGIPEPDGFEQPALLRDISDTGLFFYCKFEPTIGTEISVRFNQTDAGETDRMLVRGNVVRIVRYPGAATGIAIALIPSPKIA